MLTNQVKAWAIVDDVTGHLMMFDHRPAVYWLRRVAFDDARERGMVTEGRHRDVRIVAVDIKQHSPSRRK